MFCHQGKAQVTRYNDAWGGQGLTVVSESRSNISVNCSLTEFELEQVMVNGTLENAVHIPGVFLPNEEGAPDLPTISRYVAIPQGAKARVSVKASRTELITDVDIAPAPKIPLDIDPGPLQYVKDPTIYSKNAFYPADPVILSEPGQIRGIDVVMLAIIPFQYNPVTRELIVYRDLKVDITLEGGTGRIGDDRLRNQWWDPMAADLVLNPQSIPVIDYQVEPSANRTPDYEYIIITPNLPAYLQWADSIKVFRTLQGIKTGVVTTTEIGGNTVAAIENYVNTAYNTWDVPPVAVLLLGDYSTGTDGITSYFFNHIDPTYGTYPSDNYFADVDGNDLPDIIFARITARNATELEVMVTKFLDYERNPPTDPNFYDQPVTALGWQTERWFQICSETIGGYLKNQLGKNPVRINALYGGNPLIDPWSTAYNHNHGRKLFRAERPRVYPCYTADTGGFTGGTGANIEAAINSGTFLIMHRDHGYSLGWGEPAFSTTNIGNLTNTNNELPFVFSINCQTGAYHYASECFAEKFHRQDL